MCLCGGVRVGVGRKERGTRERKEEGRGRDRWVGWRVGGVGWEESGWERGRVGRERERSEECASFEPFLVGDLYTHSSYFLLWARAIFAVLREHQARRAIRASLVRVFSGSS